LSDPRLSFSPEVRDALDAGRPVVALESTIITHGMPWPRNVEVARLVEADIREVGAVPATIAVLDGIIRIGLQDAELDRLGTAEGVMKVSRADLPFAVSEGRHGATTVAATMICAEMAGIRVFATGGIGGVHRGAETSFDVSADLTELARSRVCVVAAGAKALLDLEKTLEVLETQGVPVIGYSTDQFPAFWSRQSGLPAPLRLDDPRAIARFLKTRETMGLSGGELVANPVPATDEIPRSEMEPAIRAALEEAERQGIAGKEVTPFVLRHIFELTGSRSLDTNIALVRNNARLAAAIAVALAERP